MPMAYPLVFSCGKWISVHLAALNLFEILRVPAKKRFKKIFHEEGRRV